MNKELKYARDFVKIGDSKIVDEWLDDGIKAVIISCCGSHFTAYLGVPKSHPLAKVESYDDLPLSVHGGLTFSGSDILLSDDFYWWGWDYAHLGDKAYLFGDITANEEDDKDWTISEVKNEVIEALYEFKKLVKIAEVCSKV